MESKGSVIYAESAQLGNYYITERSKIVVKVLRASKKKGFIILESLATDNEVEVAGGYLLREVNQEEVVKDMEKKKGKEKVKKVKANGNGKVEEGKKGRERTPFIEFELLAPAFSSGNPVKVKEILEKVKVEATKCSPYIRVYAALRKYAKEGLVKDLGKATFQLVKK